MEMTLRPVGDYDYDRDSCSFDEAWEQLEEAARTKSFVVCHAVKYSETEGYLELDYHNIRGRIKPGYITQNRYLPSEFFAGKTFCVQITALRRKSRSFSASRLLVEIEATARIRELTPGAPIAGNLIKVSNNGDYGFVDVMEGVTFYLGSHGINWKPRGCQKVSDHFSLGDRVTGFVSALEGVNSDRQSVGRLSCYRLSEDWPPATADLNVGTIVEGSAKPISSFPGSYYIELSPIVYVEFRSQKPISYGTRVRLRIKEKDERRYILLGELEESQKDSGSDKGEVPLPAPDPTPAPDPDTDPDLDAAEQAEAKAKKKQEKLAFLTPVKTTVSPFALRQGEEKVFECFPNRTPSYMQVQEKVRNGQFTDLHFQILEVVDTLVFCTSKMIAGYMTAMGTWPSGLSRDKLSNRLDSMVKLGALDRVRFSSEEGTGVFRVFFLGKNGETLLRVYRSIRRTSYNAMMLATPVEEVKRYLSTNQIILAYMQAFPFFDHFTIRRVYNADPDTPVRAPGSLFLENSNVLLETQRRYAGWQEKILEKASRYYRLMKNHQSGTLPGRSNVLQQKKLYLLLVCEDEAHARQMRDLLYGHELYPSLFFTYDLLVFQRPINESIFNFDATGSIVYYDVTELLHYNIRKPVGGEQLREENDETLNNLLQCLSQSPSVALEYLRNHDNPKLREFVRTELSELYRVDDEQTYAPVYPDEEQYYAWLLHVISRNLLKTPDASFYEADLPDVPEAPAKAPELMQAARIEPKVLEEAVQRVVSRLEVYVSRGYNGAITKHSTLQTSGTQFGYDVGMDFQVAGNNYRLAFECKSYQTLREKNEAGADARLRVGEYGKNLLQYYMYCNMYCKEDSNERNIWILVSPYADLQNDFQKNLVDRWNGDIPYMKLKAITRHQTEIDCETFFSLDPEAFRMVYQKSCPELTEEEEEALSKRIYKYIVGERTVDNDITVTLEDYHFPTISIPKNQRLTLRTPDGDDIQYAILQSLASNQSVFLVGEYGSGKTYMTLHLIETILANSNQYAYLPFWFRLVELEMGRGSGHQFRSQRLGRGSEYEAKARRFIEEGFENHHPKIRKQLRMEIKRPLVILDGLDEMFSGLGSSDEKRAILVEVLKTAKKFFGKKTLFLVSSREIDFNACFSGKESPSELKTFKKIKITPCQLEDTVRKLQEVERDYASSANDVGTSLTTKGKLMAISTKPLYYGFLREIILERDDFDVPESEIELLREVIERSINHYLNEQENGYVAYEEVLEWLCDAAVQMTLLQTRGATRREIIVKKKFAQKGYLKNVVRVTAIHDDNKYHVEFYHNAIREYLVAYTLCEEVMEHLYDGFSLEDSLCTTLQDIALTPEMITFFCALIEPEREAAELQLKALLQKIRDARYSLVGTNLISILCRMDPSNPGLRDMDCRGIHADDLHLYCCSLEKLNLQDAHLHNLHLLDVKLKDVDLRGADLSGLVLGHDGGVADACHRKQGNQISIFGLYENQQMVEYQFEDIHELKYNIFSRPSLPGKDFRVCITGDNMALYSEQKVVFTSCPEQSYLIPQGCRLLKLTPNAVLMEKRGTYELTYHWRKHREAIPTRLSPNQLQMLCCLDRTSYLYRGDHMLYLKQDEETFGITNITSTFECFTAIRDPKDHCVCVYIKYSEGIQEIRYDPRTQTVEYRSKKLPPAAYQKMVMLDCKWMYAVSDKTIFLLDMEMEELQPLPLQIQVSIQNLILEEPDGTNRVRGEREYEMLRQTMEANTEAPVETGEEQTVQS